MVRVYVQTRGKSYSEQTLLHAMKDVQQGMSQSKAADKHGIPQRTLSDKLRKAHPANVGRPTVLSDETEKQIANALDCLTDWGFPFQTIDLRIMVKNYLDNLNISQPQFRDNMPGADFVYGFLKRHKLVLRKATSLDKSRAAVSPTIVQEFFDRIKDVIDKTPPNRIYNYDETGFVNNTGNSYVIMKRGRRRAFKVEDNGKQTFSVMFAANAVGELVPPRIVYKAKNVYQNWCEGGPPGSTYGCSATGWFNGIQFENWFINNFLPFVKNSSTPPEGNTVVLLGDNLSSHYSLKVVELAKENNIYFAFLPANSTHLLQPLDVGLFRHVNSGFVKFVQEIATFYLYVQNVLIAKSELIDL